MCDINNFIKCKVGLRKEERSSNKWCIRRVR